MQAVKYIQKKILKFRWLNSCFTLNAFGIALGISMTSAMLFVATPAHAKSTVQKNTSASVESSLFARSAGQTLFIDFNNAASEITVIKKTDANTVVLPSYNSIPPKARVAARKANALLEKYTNEAQNCGVNDAVKFTPKKDTEKSKQHPCDTVFARIRQAELARIQATGNYSAADLKEEIQTLALGYGLENNNTQPYAPTTLVISGHHEMGYYRGELSQMGLDEFKQLIQDNRALFANVKTVILLGCSTGTREVYNSILLPLFPNAPVMLAAEDKAPTRDEARNLEYIAKIMALRPKLLEANNTTKIATLYERLLQHTHWPVSLLWKQTHLFTKAGLENIKP